MGAYNNLIKEWMQVFMSKFFYSRESFDKGTIFAYRRTYLSQ
jgi:hypothetical protein